MCGGVSGGGSRPWAGVQGSTLEQSLSLSESLLLLEPRCCSRQEPEASTPPMQSPAVHRSSLPLPLPLPQADQKQEKSVVPLPAIQSPAFART